MQCIFLSLLLLTTSHIHSADSLDPFNFDDTYSPIIDCGTLPGNPEKCQWDSPAALPQKPPAILPLPAHFIPLIIPSLPASAQMTINTSSDYFLEQALHFLNDKFLKENPIPLTPCQPIAPTPGIAQLPIHKSPTLKKKNTRIKNPQTPPSSPQGSSKKDQQKRYFCIEDIDHCSCSFYCYRGLKSHCSTYHKDTKLTQPRSCKNCKKDRKERPRFFSYLSLDHRGANGEFFCADINKELDAANERDFLKKKQDKAALALLISQQMKSDAQAPK